MIYPLTFLFFFSSIVFGTTLFYLLIDSDVNYLLYIFTVFTIVYCAIMRLIEHLAALSKAEENKTDEAEKFTVIIPAYLPAEKDLIIDTIKYLLNLNFPLDIILAYNTPEYLNVEKRLKNLPITVVRVPNSKSKAENINYILPKIKTKYTAIFDADHQPLAANFSKALYKLKNGYDIVQGTCLPTIDSPLSKFLSVEFNQMYNINHIARPRIWEFAIFGGSNGYFKTEILQKIAFDSGMLTEDIDLSIRALLSNHKIYFDRSIISYEKAPTNIKELWKQRTRWSQGWLQVSWKYAGQLLFGNKDQLNVKQKLGMFFLLPFREVGQFISWQTLPLAMAISIDKNSWGWLNGWFWLSLFLLGMLLIEPFWVFKVRDQKSASIKWFCLYALISPFYMLFLKTINLYAYFRQIMGNRKFEVTNKSIGTFSKVPNLGERQILWLKNKRSERYPSLSNRQTTSVKRQLNAAGFEPQAMGFGKASRQRIAS